jgi:hypothetical protein
MLVERERERESRLSERVVLVVREGGGVQTTRAVKECAPEMRESDTYLIRFITTKYTAHD